MNKLEFIKEVNKIAEEYANSHSLTLPLSPEQLLNAVVEYAETKIGNKIYFGDSVIGVNYNVGDVRIDSAFNVYQYDGSEWILKGNIGGKDGKSPTISVGTVTTGSPSDDASVTNVGDELNAIFNFVIPRGETGANGENGDAYSVYQNIVELTSISGGTSMSLTDSYFNRVPNNNEYFMYVGTYNGDTYVGFGMKDSYGIYRVTTQITKISATSTNSTKLYQHYVSLYSGGKGAYLWFISSSNKTFTSYSDFYDNIMSIIPENGFMNCCGYGFGSSPTGSIKEGYIGLKNDGAALRLILSDSTMLSLDEYGGGSIGHVAFEI